MMISVTVCVGVFELCTCSDSASVVDSRVTISASSPLPPLPVRPSCRSIFVDVQCSCAVVFFKSFGSVSKLTRLAPSRSTLVESGEQDFLSQELQGRRDRDG